MITLGLVDSVDDNGVYVTMPGSRGVLRGPYKALSTVAAGTTVLVASTDDGEQVVVGAAPGQDGAVSVAAFGAKGDGTTVDSAAVQAALDAATAGSTVVFPPGTYVCAPVTASTAGVTLVGYGATIVASGSTASPLLSVSGAGVTVRGLAVDGDGGAAFGIKVAASGVTLLDVSVTGSTNHGIWAESAGDLTVHRVVMDGCGSAGHGAGLYAYACANLTLTNCLARDSWEHGYYLLGESERGAVVTGCHAIENGVRGGGGTGFSIRQSGATVTGCYATGNELAALNVSWPIQSPQTSGSDVTVSGCVLGWSASGADREMMIVGMDDVSLVGNVITSSDALTVVRLGESGGSAVDGLMVGNHVVQDNASGNNAIIVESNGWTMSANKIEGAGVANGVSVNATVTTGLDIVSNRIKGFVNGVKLQSGSSDYVYLSGNAITDCTTAVNNSSSGTNHRIVTFDTAPDITGSRSGNAALASLLTALEGLGLITDSTT